MSKEKRESEEDLFAASLERECETTSLLSQGVQEAKDSSNEQI